MEQSMDCKPEITCPQGVKEEWRVMLLGKTGAGKSSSANTILGREGFTSDMKLSRVTQYCTSETEMLNERPVVVIDTPGLFETERTKKEVVREILKSVTLCKSGPHVFVMVIPLGRFTLEDQETNRLIESTFGRNVWKYTIVLFTHGDRMDGKTLNHIIQSGDEDLREFIRQCSGGFLVFNNKDIGDRSQVTLLLEKIETLVALNGGRYYTNKLYPLQERRIREHQERILAEKDREISRKERELEEYHKGEELKKKKRDLWRKEEEVARKQAEDEPSYLIQVLKYLGCVVMGAMIGGSITEPSYGVIIGAAAALGFMHKATLMEVYQKFKNNDRHAL